MSMSSTPPNSSNQNHTAVTKRPADTIVFATAYANERAVAGLSGDTDSIDGVLGCGGQVGLTDQVGEDQGSVEAGERKQVGGDRERRQEHEPVQDRRQVAGRCEPEHERNERREQPLCPRTRCGLHDPLPPRQQQRLDGFDVERRAAEVEPEPDRGDLAAVAGDHESVRQFVDRHGDQRHCDVDRDLPRFGSELECPVRLDRGHECDDSSCADEELGDDPSVSPGAVEEAFVEQLDVPVCAGPMGVELAQEAEDLSSCRRPARRRRGCEESAGTEQLHELGVGLGIVGELRELMVVQ